MFSREKSEKIIRGALLAVFFLPLIITPGVLFPYQYGKVVIFEVIIGILFAWVIYRANWSLFQVTPIFVSYVAFLVVRFFTGVIGDNPEKSFWGDHIRMTGTFTFLFIFIFFLLLRRAFSGIKDELKLLRIIALGGLVGAIEAVAQRFTSLGADVLGKSKVWLFGSFGNPSYFASYLVLVIFFSVLLVSCERKVKIKIFWALICVGEIVVLIATSSRGAIVGLLLGAITAGLVLLLRSKKSTVRAAGMATIILPLVLLVGSLIIYFGPGRKSTLGIFMGSLLRSGTAETRIINWRVALDGFKAKPLFGWGPENYEIIFSKFYRPEILAYSYDETWSDRPHNTMLEVAASSGILGIISYLALFLVPLWVILVRKKEVFKSGEAALYSGMLVAFWGQGFFLFDTFSALILFAAGLALIDMKFLKNGLAVGGSVSARGGWLKKVEAFLIMGLVIWGALLPVKASYLAARSEEGVAKKDYVNFEKDFIGALNSFTPYHDDLAKILGDDVLKGDAIGVIPKSVVIAVLPKIVAYLEAAANNHSNVYPLVFRSAQIFSLAGEYLDPEYFKKSEVMFDKAQRLSPERQTTAIMRVEMELASGNLFEAARRAQDFVAANPSLAAGHWFYGLVLAASGDGDGAEEQFDLAWKKGYIFGASTVQGAIKKTNHVLDFYASRGKFEKMVPILEKSIANGYSRADYPAVDSLMADYYLRLGAVYAALGKFSDARASVLKTISLDPSRRADVEEFIGAVEDLSR